jgi:hypothetical protein
MVTIYNLNSTGVRPIKLEVQITRISFYIIEDEVSLLYNAGNDPTYFYWSDPILLSLV